MAVIFFILCIKDFFLLSKPYQPFFSYPEFKFFLLFKDTLIIWEIADNFFSFHKQPSETKSAALRRPEFLPEVENLSLSEEELEEGKRKVSESGAADQRSIPHITSFMIFEAVPMIDNNEV